MAVAVPVRRLLDADCGLSCCIAGKAGYTTASCHAVSTEPKNAVTGTKMHAGFPEEI